MLYNIYYKQADKLQTLYNQADFSKNERIFEWVGNNPSAFVLERPDSFVKGLFLKTDNLQNLKKKTDFALFYLQHSKFENPDYESDDLHDEVKAATTATPTFVDKKPGEEEEELNAIEGVMVLSECNNK
uniref:Uncharacterized protein n=1 Tax=Glossina pallidipes TaxID=7398 RepID=A0A1A9ZVG3_GLOPL